MRVMRGEIWNADLGSTQGSEQSGERPVIVIQNDIGNKHSPTVIVAVISSSDKRKNSMPTHVDLSRTECLLDSDSVVMMEQIRTLSKTRLKDKIGRVPQHKMEEVDEKIKISLGLHSGG